MRSVQSGRKASEGVDILAFIAEGRVHWILRWGFGIRLRPASFVTLNAFRLRFQYCSLRPGHTSLTPSVHCTACLD